MNTQSNPTLLRNLGLWHVIIIGLAYVQPMTVLDTFGLVAEKSAGHVPTSYIIALIAMLLTAISYGQMVKYYPSSGSAYTYVQKSMSPAMGFMVGWSSWLDYLLMPMVNIVLIDIYLRALFPDVTHWFWVVGFTILMTAVNLFGSKIVAYFNSWIVLVQIVVILLFSYLMYDALHAGRNADGLIDPTNAYQLWSMTPFWSEFTTVGGLISGATVLAFSFAGFDALSSLAEETKDVKRTLPKAIFLTALISGVLFIFSTYFLQLYFSQAPSTYFANIDETQPDILRLVGGTILQAWVLGFAILTMVASGISAHAGVSRLMYVMGRDGVISRSVFGYLHPTLRTPVYNILIAGVIALSAGFLDFEFVSALISFGALTAFAFVNLSVIFRYAIKDKRHKNGTDIVRFVLLPALGFLSVVWMWTEVEALSLKAGIIWASIGLIYLAIITKGFKNPVPQFYEHKDD